jgi:hypothetical protein
MTVLTSPRNRTIVDLARAGVRPAAVALAVLVWTRRQDTAEVDDPDSPWGSV